MTQTKIDPELLISLIEKKPVIWDKTLEDYKDKKLRCAAWRDVCIILNEDFEGMEKKESENYAKHVVKKWNQIRDSWSRSLQANKKTKASGSASVIVKKYRYHNQLLFLKKIIEPAYDSEDDTEENDDTNFEHIKMENYIYQNEEMGHENSDINESLRQDNPTSAKRFKKSDVPRHKLNVMDQKFTTCIEHQMKTPNNTQNEDRNMFFFKSLLPTVALLNDDQILEFQAGVIRLLQNIKSHNR